MPISTTQAIVGTWHTGDLKIIVLAGRAPPSVAGWPITFLYLDSAFFKCDLFHDLRWERNQAIHSALLSLRRNKCCLCVRFHVPATSLTELTTYTPQVDCTFMFHVCTPSRGQTAGRESVAKSTSKSINEIKGSTDKQCTENNDNAGVPRPKYVRRRFITSSKNNDNSVKNHSAWNNKRLAKMQFTPYCSYDACDSISNRETPSSRHVNLWAYNC